MQGVYLEQVAQRQGGPGWRAGCDDCAIGVVSKLASNSTAKAAAVAGLDRVCPHGRRHRPQEVPRGLSLAADFAGGPVALELVDGVIYGPFGKLPKTTPVHVVHDGTAGQETDAAELCDRLRRGGYIPLPRLGSGRRPPVVVPKYKLAYPPAAAPAADLFGGCELPGVPTGPTNIDTIKGARRGK